MESEVWPRVGVASHICRRTPSLVRSVPARAYMGGSNALRRHYERRSLPTVETVGTKAGNDPRPRRGERRPHDRTHTNRQRLRRGNPPWLPFLVLSAMRAGTEACPYEVMRSGSFVPAGTSFTHDSCAPTVETVGYSLSPSGLGVCFCVSPCLFVVYVEMTRKQCKSLRRKHLRKVPAAVVSSTIVATT
jgi:hypothetical protein